VAVQAPLGSGTSRADGLLQYGKSGSAPAEVADPFHVGVWNFAAYNMGGSGYDYMGSSVQNVLRMIADEPGLMLIGTIAYAAHAVGVATVTVQHADGVGGYVTHSTQTGYAGETFEAQVPDDGHLHWVDLRCDSPSGTKLGFTGITWPLPLPVAGVFADWDGDGFGDLLSDDDLTPDIASWTITRGASPELTGGAQPGSATIVVNNREDDRYNPLNPAGPLYGLMADGVPVWIGVTAAGLLSGTDPRGLFGGRIKDVTPLLTPGGGQAVQTEFTCEDALGWYGRTDVQVADALYRTQREIRDAILAAAGESRVDLANEITTVPLSSWDGSALDALEQLNAANGTRHLARPEHNRDNWYAYTTRNRQYGLSAVPAATFTDSDAITGSSAWRLSADTVINRVKASVEPIVFTVATATVWEASELPFELSWSWRSSWDVDVEFDDFVTDAVLEIASTGSVITPTLNTYGRTASIHLAVAVGGTATIYALSIQGRLARRAPAESAIANDPASQAAFRGVRAGSDITGDWIGVLASARGLAQHVVWRYGNPQYRPTMTVEDSFPAQGDLDLYDTIAVTIDALGITGRLFEIVGLTHTVAQGLVSTVYVLQESRVQTDPGWFILDESLLDGTDILAY
jgi:hypothetical protein